MYSLVLMKNRAFSLKSGGGGLAFIFPLGPLAFRYLCHKLSVFLHTFNKRDIIKRLFVAVFRKRLITTPKLIIATVDKHW